MSDIQNPSNRPLSVYGDAYLLGRLNPLGPGQNRVQTSGSEALSWARGFYRRFDYALLKTTEEDNLTLTQLNAQLRRQGKGELLIGDNDASMTLGQLKEKAETSFMEVDRQRAEETLLDYTDKSNAVNSYSELEYRLDTLNQSGTQVRDVQRRLFGGATSFTPELQSQLFFAGGDRDMYKFMVGDNAPLSEDDPAVGAINDSYRILYNSFIKDAVGSSQRLLGDSDPRNILNQTLLEGGDLSSMNALHSKTDFSIRPGIGPIMELIAGAKEELKIDVFQFQNEEVIRGVVQQLLTNPNLKLTMQLAMPMGEDGSRVSDQTTRDILGPNVATMGILSQLKTAGINEQVRGELTKRVDEQLEAAGIPRHQRAAMVEERVAAALATLANRVTLQYASDKSHQKLFGSEKMVQLGSMNVTNPLGNNADKQGRNFELLRTFRRDGSALEQNMYTQVMEAIDKSLNRKTDENIQGLRVSEQIINTDGAGYRNVVDQRGTYVHLRAAMDMLKASKQRHMVMNLDQVYLLRYADLGSNIPGEESLKDTGEFGDYTPEFAENRRKSKYTMLQQDMLTMLAEGRASVVVDPNNFRQGVLNPLLNFMEETFSSELDDYGGNVRGLLNSLSQGDSVAERVSKLAEAISAKKSGGRGLTGDAAQMAALNILAVLSGNVVESAAPKQHSKAFALFERIGTTTQALTSQLTSSNMSYGSMLIDQVGAGQREVSQELGIVAYTPSTALELASKGFTTAPNGMDTSQALQFAQQEGRNIGQAFFEAVGMSAQEQEDFYQSADPGAYVSGRLVQRLIRKQANVGMARLGYRVMEAQLKFASATNTTLMERILESQQVDGRAGLFIETGRGNAQNLQANLKRLEAINAAYEQEYTRAFSTPAFSMQKSGRYKAKFDSLGVELSLNSSVADMAYSSLQMSLGGRHMSFIFRGEGNDLSSGQAIDEVSSMYVRGGRFINEGGIGIQTLFGAITSSSADLSNTGNYKDFSAPEMALQMLMLQVHEYQHIKNVVVPGKKINDFNALMLSGQKDVAYEQLGFYMSSLISTLAYGSEATDVYSVGKIYNQFKTGQIDGELGQALSLASKRLNALFLLDKKDGIPNAAAVYAHQLTQEVGGRGVADPVLQRIAAQVAPVQQLLQTTLNSGIGQILTRRQEKLTDIDRSLQALRNAETPEQVQKAFGNLLGRFYAGVGGNRDLRSGVSDIADIIYLMSAGLPTQDEVRDVYGKEFLALRDTLIPVSNLGQSAQAQYEDTFNVFRLSASHEVAISRLESNSRAGLAGLYANALYGLPSAGDPRLNYGPEVSIKVAGALVNVKSNDLLSHAFGSKHQELVAINDLSLLESTGMGQRLLLSDFKKEYDSLSAFYAQAGEGPNAQLKARRAFAQRIRSLLETLSPALIESAGIRTDYEAALLLVDNPLMGQPGKLLNQMGQESNILDKIGELNNGALLLQILQQQGGVIFSTSGGDAKLGALAQRLKNAAGTKRMLVLSDTFTSILDGKMSDTPSILAVERTKARDEFKLQLDSLIKQLGPGNIDLNNSNQKISRNLHSVLDYFNLDDQALDNLFYFQTSIRSTLDARSYTAYIQERERVEKVLGLDVSQSAIANKLLVAILARKDIEGTGISVLGTRPKEMVLMQLGGYYQDAGFLANADYGATGGIRYGLPTVQNRKLRVGDVLSDFSFAGVKVRVGDFVKMDADGQAALYRLVTDDTTGRTVERKVADIGADEQAPLFDFIADQTGGIDGGALRSTKGRRVQLRFAHHGVEMTVEAGAMSGDLQTGTTTYQLMEYRTRKLTTGDRLESLTGGLFKGVARVVQGKYFTRLTEAYNRQQNTDIDASDIMGMANPSNFKSFIPGHGSTIAGNEELLSGLKARIKGTSVEDIMTGLMMVLGPDMMFGAGLDGDAGKLTALVQASDQSGRRSLGMGSSSQSSSTMLRERALGSLLTGNDQKYVKTLKDLNATGRGGAGGMRLGMPTMLSGFDTNTIAAAMSGDAASAESIQQYILKLLDYAGTTANSGPLDRSNLMHRSIDFSVGAVDLALQLVNSQVVNLGLPVNLTSKSNLRQAVAASGVINPQTNQAYTSREFADLLSRASYEEEAREQLQTIRESSMALFQSGRVIAMYTNLAQSAAKESAGSGKAIRPENQLRTRSMGAAALEIIANKGRHRAAQQFVMSIHGLIGQSNLQKQTLGFGAGWNNDAGIPMFSVLGDADAEANTNRTLEFLTYYAPSIGLAASTELLSVDEGTNARRYQEMERLSRALAMVQSFGVNDYAITTGESSAGLKVAVNDVFENLYKGFQVRAGNNETARADDTSLVLAQEIRALIDNDLTAGIPVSEAVSRARHLMNTRLKGEYRKALVDQEKMEDQRNSPMHTIDRAKAAVSRMANADTESFILTLPRLIEGPGGSVHFSYDLTGDDRGAVTGVVMSGKALKASGLAVQGDQTDELVRSQIKIMQTLGNQDMIDLLTQLTLASKSSKPGELVYLEGLSPQVKKLYKDLSTSLLDSTRRMYEYSTSLASLDLKAKVPGNTRVVTSDFFLADGVAVVGDDANALAKAAAIRKGESTAMIHTSGIDPQSKKLKEARTLLLNATDRLLNELGDKSIRELHNSYDVKGAFHIPGDATRQLKAERTITTSDGKQVKELTYNPFRETLSILGELKANLTANEGVSKEQFPDLVHRFDQALSLAYAAGARSEMIIERPQPLGGVHVGESFLNTVMGLEQYNTMVESALGAEAALLVPERSQNAAILGVLSRIVMNLGDYDGDMVLMIETSLVKLADRALVLQAKLDIENSKLAHLTRKVNNTRQLNTGGKSWLHQEGHAALHSSWQQEQLELQQRVASLQGQINALNKERDVIRAQSRGQEMYARARSWVAGYIGIDEQYLAGGVKGTFFRSLGVADNIKVSSSGMSGQQWLGKFDVLVEEQAVAMVEARHPGISKKNRKYAALLQHYLEEAQQETMNKILVTGARSDAKGETKKYAELYDYRFHEASLSELMLSHEKGWKIFDSVENFGSHQKYTEAFRILLQVHQDAKSSQELKDRFLTGDGLTEAGTRLLGEFKRLNSMNDDQALALVKNLFDPSYLPILQEVLDRTDKSEYAGKSLAYKAGMLAATLLGTEAETGVNKLFGMGMGAAQTDQQFSGLQMIQAIASSSLLGTSVNLLSQTLYQDAALHAFDAGATKMAKTMDPYSPTNLKFAEIQKVLDTAFQRSARIQGVHQTLGQALRDYIKPKDIGNFNERLKQIQAEYPNDPVKQKLALLDLVREIGAMPTGMGDLISMGALEQLGLAVTISGNPGLLSSKGPTEGPGDAMGMTLTPEMDEVLRGFGFDSAAKRSAYQENMGLQVYAESPDSTEKKINKLIEEKTTSDLRMMVASTRLITHWGFTGTGTESNIGQRTLYGISGLDELQKADSLKTLTTVLQSNPDFNEKLTAYGYRVNTKTGKVEYDSSFDDAYSKEAGELIRQGKYDEVENLRRKYVKRREVRQLFTQLYTQEGQGYTKLDAFDAINQKKGAPNIASLLNTILVYDNSAQGVEDMIGPKGLMESHFAKTGVQQKALASGIGLNAAVDDVTHSAFLAGLMSKFGASKDNLGEAHIQGAMRQRIIQRIQSDAHTVQEITEAPNQKERKLIIRKVLLRETLAASKDRFTSQAEYDMVDEFFFKPGEDVSAEEQNKLHSDLARAMGGSFNSDLVDYLAESVNSLESAAFIEDKNRQVFTRRNILKDMYNVHQPNANIETASQATSIMSTTAQIAAEATNESLPVQKENLGGVSVEVVAVEASQFVAQQNPEALKIALQASAHHQTATDFQRPIHRTQFTARSYNRTKESSTYAKLAGKEDILDYLLPMAGIAAAVVSNGSINDDVLQQGVGGMITSAVYSVQAQRLMKLSANVNLGIEDPSAVDVLKKKHRKQWAGNLAAYGSATGLKAQILGEQGDTAFNAITSALVQETMFQAATMGTTMIMNKGMQVFTPLNRADTGAHIINRGKLNPREAAVAYTEAAEGMRSAATIAASVMVGTFAGIFARSTYRQYIEPLSALDRANAMMDSARQQYAADTIAFMQTLQNTDEAHIQDEDGFDLVASVQTDSFSVGNDFGDADTLPGEMNTSLESDALDTGYVGAYGNSSMYE